MFNFSSILLTGKSPDVESDTIYFLPVLQEGFQIHSQVLYVVIGEIEMLTNTKLHNDILTIFVVVILQDSDGFTVETRKPLEE